MVHQHPRFHPGLLSFLLLGLVSCQYPLVSRAYTRAPTGHPCCTWEIQHCSMSGVRPGLPAECSAGHRSTDVDCDDFCCLGHAFFDPCLGFIIGGHCNRGSEDSSARDSDGDGLNNSDETCGKGHQLRRGLRPRSAGHGSQPAAQGSVPRARLDAGTNAHARRCPGHGQ
jgi:hypothetical protein